MKKTIEQGDIYPVDRSWVMECGILGAKAEVAKYIEITGVSVNYLAYNILDKNQKKIDNCTGCLQVSMINSQSMINSHKNNTNTNNMDNKMNLMQKFAVALKGEPQKTFIKAGIMDADESLTNEGRELWTMWLVSKFGAEFKADVVDKIIADESAAK